MFCFVGRLLSENASLIYEFHNSRHVHTGARVASFQPLKKFIRRTSSLNNLGSKLHVDATFKLVLFIIHTHKNTHKIISCHNWSQNRFATLNCFYFVQALFPSLFQLSKLYHDVVAQFINQRFHVRFHVYQQRFRFCRQQVGIWLTCSGAWLKWRRRRVHCFAWVISSRQLPRESFQPLRGLSFDFLDSGSIPFWRANHQIFFVFHPYTPRRVERKK